jgi:hypothetical protein
LLGIQRKGILRSVVHSSIKQYIGKNEIHTLYVIIIKTKKYAYVWDIKNVTLKFYEALIQTNRSDKTMIII